MNSVNSASIKQLNGILFDECRRNGVKFADNETASEINLWADDIHLTESVKRIIASSLINKLNRFLEFTNPFSWYFSENTLLPEKTSTRNLISDKLGNSEITLTYQSTNRSIDNINNAPLNFLSEILELRLQNVNRVLLILTETKLDKTFLISQFLIDGFSKP